VAQYTHHMDHLYISWMHPLDGHIFCLLSTQNQVFAKLLAQLIKLRAHFLDYPIKKICLDNACEFTSHAFNEYCMSIGIEVEHPVAHVYTQNGLVES